LTGQGCGVIHPMDGRVACAQEVATALIFGGSGAGLLILLLIITFVLLGRRVRRGRYTYRAKPHGTYDNSSSNPHSPRLPRRPRREVANDPHSGCRTWIH
jgi:hypothetical protein